MLFKANSQPYRAKNQEEVKQKALFNLFLPIPFNEYLSF